MAFNILDPNTLCDIVSTLKSWCFGTPPGPVAERLLNISVEISSQDYEFQTGLYQLAKQEETSPSLMARSVLGYLFHSSGPDSYLGKAFAEFLESDDVTILREFERIVKLKGNQLIHKKIPECDPASKRIKRNILQALRGHQGILCFPSDRLRYATVRGQTELRSKLLPWQLEELCEIYGSRFNAHISEGGRICLLLGTVVESDDQQAFVRIDVLKSAIVTYYRARFNMEITESGGFNRADPIEIVARERGVELVSMKINEKLDELLTKNKICPEFHELYYLGLSDMLDDLWEFSDVDTHMHYLGKYIPDLTLESYRKTHRQFDDLVTQAKREFGEVISR